MNIHIFLPLMTMVLNLGLVGAIFSRPTRIPGRSSFVAFLLTIVVWAGAQTAVSASTSAIAAERWHQLLLVAAMLYPPLFLQFSYTFAERKLNRRVLTASYSAAGAGIGLAVTGMLVTEMVPSGAGFSPRVTPFFLAMMPFVYGGAILAFRNVWHAHVSSPSVLMRNRARYLIVGSLSAMLFGTIDLASVLGVANVFVSSIGNLIFGVMASVALLNDRLTDLRRAVRRQTAHVLMLALVGGGAGAALLGFATALGANIHPYVMIASVSIFYALVSPLVHQRIHGWVDRVWYGDGQRSHRTLKKFGAEVRGVHDMQLLGATMVYLVREATQAEHVSLLERVPRQTLLRTAASVGTNAHLEVTFIERGPLADALTTTDCMLGLDDLMRSSVWESIPTKEQDQIVESGIELLVPATFNGNLAGVLALGPRTDGTPYQQEEIELLFTIVQEVAPAIENARLHDELHGQLREIQETQAQLLQAGRLATLGTLASGVAHEISNPLFSILGRVELLRADSRRHLKSEKAVEYVDVIAEMSDRISEIVTALQTFSRRDGARGMIRVNALIDSTVALMERDLELSGITLERKFDTRDPQTEGNQPKLKQALMNVVLNARDAMPRGGKLTLTSTSDAGHIYITCADSGHGLGGVDVSRIFDAFYTTKDQGLGAGLGLYVTQSIIDEHQGRIEFDNHLETGTSVTITLPRQSSVALRADDSRSDKTQVVGAPVIKRTVSSGGGTR